jgi:hypothetical protein
MSIKHGICIIHPIQAEWSNTFNDYVCTNINFQVFSSDSDKPTPNGPNQHLTVYNYKEITLGSANSNNFIAYSTVMGNPQAYAIDWIKNQVDIDALQRENQQKLNN